MTASSTSCGAPPSAQMLAAYYNRMVEPIPFQVRKGNEFAAHQEKLRRAILERVGLSPLPERLPLDVRRSKTLDHPWCTITAISYQLWPTTRSGAFLYLPKDFDGEPAPAMLCPVGHWPNGNAEPAAQTRCLNFARRGYVVLCTTQNHFEDLAIGFSHQTLMIWNNMRALDVLCSMPEVAAERIGCAGLSGGGLQTQMLAALDERVKVATIGGITCDYREKLCPHGHHCECVFWPGVMQVSDQPEIAALALPRPIQFLTMDDWTGHFVRDNVPQIQALYDANGVGDRLDCGYWNTPHLYDKPKRERTYWWADRWLRGCRGGEPEEEPDTETPDVDTLNALMDSVVDRKQDYAQLAQLFRGAYGTKRIGALRPEDVTEHRSGLRRLLGMDAVLPVTAQAPETAVTRKDGWLEQRVAVPAEGPVLVPTIVLCSDHVSPREIHIVCDDRPKEERLADPDIREAVQNGTCLVLPDIRFTGALALDHLRGTSWALVEFPVAHPRSEPECPDFEYAWTRNSIVWGRPLPGMAATDILAVLDSVMDLCGLTESPGVRLTARGSTRAGALFAGCLDDRIRTLDLDLGDDTFGNGSLPLIPGILRHGDVPLWLAVAEYKAY